MRSICHPIPQNIKPFFVCGLLGAVLATSAASAAVVVTSEVWINVPFRSPYPYQKLISSGFDGYRMQPYDGVGGGSITVALDPLESVLSVSMIARRAGGPTPPREDILQLYSGSSGPISGPSTVTFDYFSIGPSGEINPLIFHLTLVTYNDPDRIYPLHQSINISFLVKTTQGDFVDDNNGLGYTALIPEPSAGMIVSLLALSGVLCRFRPRREVV